MNAKKMIRFVDPYNNPLFELPSGEKIRTITLEGKSSILPCSLVDSDTFRVGYYKITPHHFARLMAYEGARYYPLHPKHNPDIAYYVLYRREMVQEKPDTGEYNKYYQGMLAPGISVEVLIHWHTYPTDGQDLPSLFPGDIIVLHREGRRWAYRLDRQGLVDYPGFFKEA